MKQLMSPANILNLVKKFDAIQKKEHQHAHIREWEFIDPKFKVKNERVNKLLISPASPGVHLLLN